VDFLSFSWDWQSFKKLTTTVFAGTDDQGWLFSLDSLERQQSAPVVCAFWCTHFKVNVLWEQMLQVGRGYPQTMSRLSWVSSLDFLLTIVTVGLSLITRYSEYLCHATLTLALRHYMWAAGVTEVVNIVLTVVPVQPQTCIVALFRSLVFSVLSSENVYTYTCKTLHCVCD